MATPYSLMDTANRIAYDAIQRLDYDEMQEIQRTCESWHDGPKSAMHAFSKFILLHEAVKPSVYKRLSQEAVDTLNDTLQHEERTKLMKLRDFAQELAAAIEAATQIEKHVAKAKAAGVSPFLLAEIVSKATAPQA